MRKYEAIVIFYPNTEEEERTKVLERLSNIISANGSVESVEEWGDRKLAYLIDDYSNGYYVLCTFNANQEAINELDRVAKITESIMRHMVVRIDD
ncbi:MAG: 30S ribosomal protein S6 [Tissierellia bacterium]|nr:30S ribosomal protein S6 [Tissierellia bacterium]